MTPKNLPGNLSRARVSRLATRALLPLILAGGIGKTPLFAAGLTWTGAQGDLWDVGTTPNWTTGAAASTYADGTAVTFDNTGAAGTVLISNGGNGVMPLSVTVNNSAGHDYTIAGAPLTDGSGGTEGINGSASLTKTGTGNLTLASDNGFTGSINILQGNVNVSDFYGNVGSGNLGNGTGTLTLGGTVAGQQTAGTLTFTGSSQQNFSNPIVIAGAGGTFATDYQLINNATLSGSGPLTITSYKAGGGEVDFNDGSTFTGSIHLVSGFGTFAQLGLASTTRSITLPAAGPSAGFLTYNGGNLGSAAAPDHTNVTTPAAGGEIYVGLPAGTWYTSGTLTDVAGGQPFTKDGPGGLIFSGQVTLHQLPTITNGTLGFANVSTSSPNVFPSGVMVLNQGATLLTHLGSIGNATVKLNGGVLSLVGEGSNSVSSNFGYNIPVTATGGATSGVLFSNGYQAILGHLDLPNSVTFNSGGGRVSFASTSFDTAQSTYGFFVDTGGDLSPGAMTGTGLSLTKAGDGALSLDSASSTATITDIDIQQGRLQLLGSAGGANSPGGGTITFDNNTLGVTPGLVLSSTSGNPTFSIPLTINSTSSASITAAQTPFGSAVSTATVTVGPSASTPNLAINTGNVLTLNSVGNYTLNMGLPIVAGTSGAGDVTVTSGIVNFTTNGNTINNFINSGGTANFNGTTSVQTVTDSGGITTFLKAPSIPTFTNSGGTTNFTGPTTIGTFTNSGGTAVISAPTTITGATTLGGGTTNFNAATSVNGALSISGIANIAAPVTAGSTITIPGGNVTVTSSLAAQSSGVALSFGGTLAFNNASYTGGPISVNSGTITETGNTNMHGATINIAPVNSVVALTENYYAGGDSTNSLTQGDPAFLPLQKPTNTRTLFGGQTVFAGEPLGISFTSDQAMSTHFYGAVNDWRASWTGTMTMQAGTYSFATQSDDGSALFIDLNRNGSFGDGGEEIVNNNAYQGAHQAVGTVTIPVAGTYPIFIGYYQGQGDYNMEARYKFDGTGAVDTNYGDLQVILASANDPFHNGSGGGTINVGGTMISGPIASAPTINVQAGGALQVPTGGINSVSALNLANGGSVTLAGSGSSGVTTLGMTGTGTATLTTGPGHTLNIAHLDVPTGNTLNITGGGTTAIVGPSDTGTTGTLAINGGNVNAGFSTLNVAVPAGVTVQSAGGAGGVLGGYASFGPITSNAGGTLAPGAAAGALTGSTVTLNSGSHLSLTLNSATLASQLVGTSAVTLNGDVNLSLTLGYTPANGATFNFLKDNGSGGLGSGQFDYGGKLLANNAAFTATSNGITESFSIQYTPTGATLTALPEPSALVAFAVGAGVVVGVRRPRARL